MSFPYLHKCKSLAAALEVERPSVNPCSKQKNIQHAYQGFFLNYFFKAYRHTQSFQYWGPTGNMGTNLLAGPVTIGQKVTALN